MPRLTNEQLREKGYSVLIFQAIRAAGGAKAVADELDLAGPTVTGWGQRGSVPDKYVDRLAKMTRGLVTASQIREEIRKNLTKSKGGRSKANGPEQARAAGG